MVTRTNHQGERNLRRATLPPRKGKASRVRASSAAGGAAGEAAECRGSHPEVRVAGEPPADFSVEAEAPRG